ncbi:uncharacterized protein BKCO1_4900010 [Diplodia corticola]|uniref:Uncharacterized protein n=1 Tax=Diplodia corticola TaxID=236234 RepID=A0A1J9QTT0_9PEZI|nr:uncharacterized protein BKCO1_4900010 [Diplodia corticola]OJD31394.1 hypothetical protein BKCO1_4900010 [Diplodia corticola]
MSSNPSSSISSSLPADERMQDMQLHNTTTTTRHHSPATESIHGSRFLAPSASFDGSPRRAMSDRMALPPAAPITGGYDYAEIPSGLPIYPAAAAPAHPMNGPTSPGYNPFSSSPASSAAAPAPIPAPFQQQQQQQQQHFPGPSTPPRQTSPPSSAFSPAAAESDDDDDNNNNDNDDDDNPLLTHLLTTLSGSVRAAVPLLLRPPGAYTGGDFPERARARLTAALAPLLDAHARRLRDDAASADATAAWLQGELDSLQGVWVEQDAEIASLRAAVERARDAEQARYEEVLGMVRERGVRDGEREGEVERLRREVERLRRENEVLRGENEGLREREWETEEEGEEEQQEEGPAGEQEQQQPQQQEEEQEEEEEEEQIPLQQEENEGADADADDEDDEDEDELRNMRRSKRRMLASGASQAVASAAAVAPAAAAPAVATTAAVNFPRQVRTAFAAVQHQLGQAAGPFRLESANTLREFDAKLCETVEENDTDADEADELAAAGSRPPSPVVAGPSSAAAGPSTTAGPSLTTAGPSHTTAAAATGPSTAAGPSSTTAASASATTTDQHLQTARSFLLARMQLRTTPTPTYVDLLPSTTPAVAAIDASLAALLHDRDRADKGTRWADAGAFFPDYCFRGAVVARRRPRFDAGPGRACTECMGCGKPCMVRGDHAGELVVLPRRDPGEGDWREASMWVGEGSASSSAQQNRGGGAGGQKRKRRRRY